MFQFLLVPVVAVNIVVAPCPYKAAEVSCYVARTNAVYIAPVAYRDPVTRRSILAHELGHAYDNKVMSESDREYLRDMLEVRGLEWKADTETPGSEAFANYYEDCALGYRYWRNNFVCNWLWQRAPYRLFSAAIRRASRQGAFRAYR